MSNYKTETKCIQSGYEPGNGEARVLPIYQSTMMRLLQKSVIWKAEWQQC